MLLPRISRHLKEQNWTGVVLDFAIVVIGVFIGLQVSNWNSARTDRIEAGRARARLERDFQRNLARTEKCLSMHVEYMAAAGRLVEGVRTSEYENGSINTDLTLAT